MMQAGVCLRQDTETTLPELTEQHRIRLKEEELSGLESETECAAPGLNTLEPECVTAHSRGHRGAGAYPSIHWAKGRNTPWTGPQSIAGHTHNSLTPSYLWAI
ncbi:hypothetical protein COCON_G00020290 [Conger conger]|uniref:Uncharacterized protein n=1 Tax=Conger conger TaxID=82655 RepID=A0A9Q1DX53_CONCO|nr:hypothetical protein COCON_G00020290 [Conger conger]